MFLEASKFFVIIYGAMELWTGIMNDPTDNVAHFAHLGGMLFGFILIKLWKKDDINRFFDALTGAHKEWRKKFSDIAE